MKRSWNHARTHHCLSEGGLLECTTIQMLIVWTIFCIQKYCWVNTTPVSWMVDLDVLYVISQYVFIVAPLTYRQKQNYFSPSFILTAMQLRAVLQTSPKVKVWHASELLKVERRGQAGVWWRNTQAVHSMFQKPSVEAKLHPPTHTRLYWPGSLGLEACSSSASSMYSVW